MTTQTLEPKVSPITPEQKNAVDLINRTITELKTRGWCRGVMESYDGEVCLVGAYTKAMKVLGIEPEYHSEPKSPASIAVCKAAELRVNASKAKAIAIMRPAVDNDLPLGIPNVSLPSLYNDFVARDVEDVISLLEDAKALVLK